MYRGRGILGDELFLGVQCSDAPDAAPEMRIYTEAGVLVTTKQLPPLDRSATGLFGYMLPLGTGFSTGRHYARYTYAVSGDQRSELDAFEILPGGHADGQIISMAFLERPDGNDWIIAQDDMGTGPRIFRGPRV